MRQTAARTVRLTARGGEFDKRISKNSTDRSLAIPRGAAGRCGRKHRHAQRGMDSAPYCAEAGRPRRIEVAPDKGRVTESHAEFQGEGNDGGGLDGERTGSAQTRGAVSRK